MKIPNLRFLTNQLLMSSKKQTIQLLATGSLVPTLHYGIYAVNWWTFINKKTPNEEKQICIPLRLNMRVQIELNKTKLIVRIVSIEGNINPGYVCESDVDSKIYLSASEAINKTYNKLFNNKTRYTGPSVLGFDNENITQELLSDVLFCPFKITAVDKLSILIIELDDDMIGYLSSFMYKYQGKQSLFVQKIESKYYYIEVFQKKERVAFYSDVSPTKVWEKTRILKNYNESPICSVNEWNNIEVMVMSEAFEKHLKRKISVVELNWHGFFIEWKEQESNIIEFMMHLKPLYPLDYEFTDQELRAWRKMMKSVGCTNITPYKKQESKPEFWTCSVDSSSEKNKQLKVIIEKFWKSFKEAIRVNKCGLDGKQRILSIIVENLGYREIQKNFTISNDLINAAKKYSRVNGPGCPAKVKPIVKRNCISKIKDIEFESFFSDKENVTMSSYRVDPKTNLPLLYLKDNKEALWQKFEGTILME
ncbi:hypothetical protein GLOIN_2v1535567 [Rhizophagus clarus]|uniref:Uncharacterized protein n=1 Tax=Rhizophagus clarus TaxID=94130 RepID=A0A8H3QTQ0_9GLOM|nr:hypothetical protein GLOIN_2v1535567 [Rhizophagus clarus]